MKAMRALVKRELLRRSDQKALRTSTFFGNQLRIGAIGDPFPNFFDLRSQQGAGIEWHSRVRTAMVKMRSFKFHRQVTAVGIARNDSHQVRRTGLALKRKLPRLFSGWSRPAHHGCTATISASMADTWHPDCVWLQRPHNGIREGPEAESPPRNPRQRGK